MPNIVGRDRHVHISFMHVDAENEILCHEPGISAVIFFLFARIPMVKTYWENSPRPSSFRSIQVNIYHAHVVFHSPPLYASLSSIL